MKAVALLLAALVLPASANAQDEPPPGLAAVELARSQACVGSLARLADLNRRLDPFAARMERLQAVGRAISLEDVAVATPFSTTDSVEIAASQWFAADEAMAQRLVAAPDSALAQQRAASRAQILDVVRSTMAAVNDRAQEEMVDADQIGTDARPCEGAILVRSAVLEACAGVSSDLCSAAADTATVPDFRFVDNPMDLWNVEDFRPWTDPQVLQSGPDGSIAGGRTASRSRRGNIVLIVGLTPMLRLRSSLTPEEILEFESNLDSLGFTFDHPDFVMAPALEFQANIPAPMGGETHYLLHFGDLSGDDVIWSLETGTEGVVQATFPAAGADLARLQAGEMVSLTAIKVVEGEDAQAEPVFTIPLIQVGQSQAVGRLLQYMSSGDLSQDLAELVPPVSNPGTGGR